jgi:hypothetical protein
MKKIMMIFRGPSGESYEKFEGRMMEIVGEISENVRPARLSVTYTCHPPPLLSIIPFRKNRISVISVWYSGDEGVPDVPENSGLCGAYLVEEALPVAYQKTWPEGEVTPGVCLLTLFTRKPGLDHNKFLDRWHNSHTPLSLRIHPLWHYNRNVVRKRLQTTAEPWEGIVEEHFRKRSDLVNPFRFFGNPIRIIPNMIEVYKDTNSFLDYNTIETYMVREKIVKE